jgi:hypothetical protein
VAAAGGAVGESIIHSRRLRVAATVCVLAGPPVGSAGAQTIVSMGPAFDCLVPRGTKIGKIVGGHQRGACAITSCGIRQSWWSRT